jgi:hypothetical protein
MYGLPPARSVRAVHDARRVLGSGVCGNTLCAAREIFTNLPNCQVTTFPSPFHKRAKLISQPEMVENLGNSAIHLVVSRRETRENLRSQRTLEFRARQSSEDLPDKFRIALTKQGDEEFRNELLNDTRLNN